MGFTDHFIEQGSEARKTPCCCCSVSSHVWLFATPWTAARQVSSPSPRVCPSSGPLNRWCHSTISSSVIPFSSCLQSWQRVFSNELALHIRWPKYWSISFSISPSNEYSGLISFRLTDLISLLSKGLSRVFSSTTVQKHQFFVAQPCPALTSIHDYCKNHVLTIWTCIGKVMSAF